MTTNCTSDVKPSLTNLIVQKYGGSSLASPQALLQVAQQVNQRRQSCQGLVVVVSAMGDTTDMLLALAQHISKEPTPRELAMLVSVGERITMALLAMALHDLGCPAISLTGSQSGIITTLGPQHSRIVEIRTARIEEALSQGKIVVVAGFQGMNLQGEITTLARGGSDSSAVALACALGASQCEIFSDVPGVLSADPRICPQAQTLPHLSYATMASMANLGANVLHVNALTHGQAGTMPIVCRATDARLPAQTRIDSQPVAVTGPIAVSNLRQCVAIRQLAGATEPLAKPWPKLSASFWQQLEQAHWTIVWQTSEVLLLDGKDASLPWDPAWLAPWPMLQAQACAMVSVIGMDLLRHGSQPWHDWLATVAASTASTPSSTPLQQSGESELSVLPYWQPLLTSQAVSWLTLPACVPAWSNRAHHRWCQGQ